MLRSNGYRPLTSILTLSYDLTVNNEWLKLALLELGKFLSVMQMAHDSTLIADHYLHLATIQAKNYPVK